MSDIAAEMRRAVELRGDTYSSMEIWGLLGRGAAEIERLQAEMREITSQCHNLPRSATADRIDQIAHRALEEGK